MAKVIIGSGVKVDLSKTFGPNISVTAVTKANPGVATAAGHGLANGDVVRFSVDDGMIQLDGQPVRVAAVTTNTFELEELDTTGFNDFTAGAAQKVTAWDGADNLTGWALNEGTANWQDTTTIHDIDPQRVPGMNPPLEGTMPMLSSPHSAFVRNLRAASESQRPVVQRVTLPDNSQYILNSYVSGGRGINLSPQQRSEATASFSTVRKVMVYE